MLVLLLLFCSSIFANEVLEPKLGYQVQDEYLHQLTSVFNPLKDEELISNWGKEYTIGLYFAGELDLYQAITAFKRAAILIPETNTKRRREIDYQIINAYYLGGKHEEVTRFFDKSLLANIESSFPAFHDLLVILYDSLKNQKEDERTDRIFVTMEKYFPTEKKKLEISNAILAGDLELISASIEDQFIDTSIASLETSLDNDFYEENSGMRSVTESLHIANEKKLKSLYHLRDCREGAEDIFSEYKSKKKNPFLAGGLNAVCPGLGYLYLGQKQSALTALLLNGLTTSAAYYFYSNNNLPAAALTLSFESGWYFGGIYGATEEAKFYNKRTFEDAAHYRLRDQKLYPILMLRHGF